MGVWGEQAVVPVRGDTGVRANVFAITFIFLCQGSWGPGHLAGGLWGGAFSTPCPLVVSVLGSWKWERPMKRIPKFNVLSMISFCCWHLPSETDTDSRLNNPSTERKNIPAVS